MTSNPAFTDRNIQKADAYLLYSRHEQKSLVTYHTLQSLYVCAWLVNTLTSTAPIGSPIICMWSPADIREQWERNLSCSSPDVRGAGTRDEPLRTSAWEATTCWQNEAFTSEFKFRTNPPRLGYLFPAFNNPAQVLLKSKQLTKF